jgi:hypothetical protein
MNLVDLIKSQLTGDNLGKISSLIGESHDHTQKAIGAAVPSMLSGLASLASSSGGAGKLASALSNFDAGSFSNLGGILSGNTGAILEKGGGLLGSLFGNSAIGSIAGALSKFSGVGSESIKKLLGYLAPFILGTVVGNLKGKKADAQGLTSLLA